MRPGQFGNGRFGRNYRPCSFDPFGSALLSEILGKRLGLFGSPGDLGSMEGIEVKSTQFIDDVAELPGEPGGSQRVGVSGMRIVKRNPVCLTKDTQSPPSLAESVVLLVKDVRINHQERFGATDQIDQCFLVVTPRFAIKDGQIETSVESNNRNSSGSEFGKMLSDLEYRLIGGQTFATGAFRSDPVDRSGFSRYLDPGIDQPVGADGLFPATNHADRGRNDTVILRIGPSGFDVEGGQPPGVPTHKPDGTGGFGRQIRYFEFVVSRPRHPRPEVPATATRQCRF